MSTRTTIARWACGASLGLALTGCMFHHHRVGSGPAGVGSISARQYYLGFGLWRLNEVDTQRFTADAVSYDITSEFSFTDLLISAMLSPLTVTTRTLTVDR